MRWAGEVHTSVAKSAAAFGRPAWMKQGSRVPDAVQRSLALLCRAGTHGAALWAPAQQRTAPQGRRAAPRPGHESGPVAPLFLSRFAAEGETRRKRRRGDRRGRHGEAGFTLVEVIVALAMLSIGLSIVLGLISSSLRQTANAERMAQASSLAQSLMDQIGTEWPVVAAERDGQFPNGYRWHLQMLPYGDASERDEWPVGLYTVSTEVQWEEGKERRAFALTSLRFGPRPQRR
jgi:general secretion pathway protein I